MRTIRRKPAGRGSEQVRVVQTSRFSCFFGRHPGEVCVRSARRWRAHRHVLRDRAVPHITSSFQNGRWSGWLRRVEPDQSKAAKGRWGRESLRSPTFLSLSLMVNPPIQGGTALTSSSKSELKCFDSASPGPPSTFRFGVLSCSFAAEGALVVPERKPLTKRCTL